MSTYVAAVQEFTRIARRAERWHTRYAGQQAPKGSIQAAFSWMNRMDALKVVIERERASRGLPPIDDTP